mgnify:CR=1 FL=1
MSWKYNTESLYLPAKVSADFLFVYIFEYNFDNMEKVEKHWNMCIYEDVVECIFMRFFDNIKNSKKSKL